MTLVAAFAVSAYGYCTARAGHKPFNPLLGETFECIRDDKGFKYIAEQVNEFINYLFDLMLIIISILFCLKHSNLHRLLDTSTSEK